MLRKIWKKYRHISTKLNFNFCPHQPPYLEDLRPKLAKNATQKAFEIFIPHVGTQFCEKKGEELPQLCVCKHGCRSKLPSTHGNTHTTMATPLPLSVENATDPTCDIAIWVMFLFFPGS